MDGSNLVIRADSCRKVIEQVLPMPHLNGFLSVAYIARRVPTVTMSDGISTLPSKVAEHEEYSLRDDEERRVRIDRLIAAIEAYLTSVGDRVDILFYDDLIFGDRRRSV